MSITFSSCFYIIKSKFDPSVYVKWMNNLLSIVHNFNLVIYTDENSSKHINVDPNNKHIKVIILPLESFHNYRYKTYWEKNHEKNVLLKDKSSWELNMLWSEKINFVKTTMERKYFETEFYGWCDIGYFRNRPNDLNTSYLKKWPDNKKIRILDRTKIAYACVNNDERFINSLYSLVNDKTPEGLPKKPIPPAQVSVAGGFFILHKSMIYWWFTIFDNKLKLYFENDYLVKDDQIILIDCILSNLSKFSLYREENPMYDNWFMFQRYF